MNEDPTIRVMALHALVYCERLFYLEEVEEIRVADERVYAGRTLHDTIEEGEVRTFEIEDSDLGLRGRVDAVRRRNGCWLPYEHKRGRARYEGAVATAWPSDRVQLAAYAILLERVVGEPIPEGRLRYHANAVTVRVPMDAALRGEVVAAVQRARALTRTTDRPPVHQDERVCARCSLAPVCLPEESRALDEGRAATIRLFPAIDERQSVHVFGHGTRVGKSGDELAITPRESPVARHPVRLVRSLSIHGYGSVSAQALAACARYDIAVHWFGAGGRYVGTFHADSLAVQRRIRQFQALSDPQVRLSLARRLIAAKVQAQLGYALRATRKTGREPAVSAALERLRAGLGSIGDAASPDALLGHEGNAAAGYFAILATLVKHPDPSMVPRGRSRRPPRDPFNAALSFGYS